MTTTGMEEIIALESALRKALDGKLSLADRIAASWLLGSAYRGAGTRLQALRDVVGRLGQ